MPKVSVIIPVYNVEKYLRECLDSVINQTLSDIEIILIDDGGKDNCPQIIDEYANKDNRIISIHKQNGGYGQTCNVGLERATGEYVAIVEPDDYIDSNMYEDLYNIACKYNSDIVKSCFYDNLQAKEEQRILKTKWADDKIPQDRSFTVNECGLFLQYHPSIWSCIYKREFLEKHHIRFVEAPGAGWTDNPFQVQTMCLAERINYTPNAYYYWRRLNKDESDDLKDYTIPFKRTNEIHKWLEENDIKGDEIYSNLYAREMAYIEIVLGKRHFKEIDDALVLVNDLLNKIDKNLLRTTKNVNSSAKKVNELIFNSPLKYRKKIIFRKNKQDLISIRWNKYEKRIILFGKTILCANKKLKNQYDLYVSLGYGCPASRILRNNNLQYWSFPFDWVFGTDIVGKSKILSNNFKDYLKKDYLKMYSQVTGCDCYKNTENAIGFPHDFKLNTPLDVSYPSVKEKYDRRIHRLIGMIENARRVLFIYITTGDDDKTYDNHDLITAQEIISKRFPNVDVDILFFENSQTENLNNFIKINKHITKYSFNHKHKSLYWEVDDEKISHVLKNNYKISNKFLNFRNILQKYKIFSLSRYKKHNIYKIFNVIKIKIRIADD